MPDDSPSNDEDSNPVTGKVDYTYALDEDESPSEAVVRTVASYTDTDVLDLEPLQTVIDVEHLDGLFENARRKRSIERNSITFHFDGCEITVTQDDVYVTGRNDAT